MEIFPPHQIDFYKSGHMYQYPEGTELVFSNFTPRSSRIEGVDSVVLFGLQYYIKEYLLGQWQRNFFDKDIEQIVEKYEQRMFTSLGPDSVSGDHLRQLHDLGYMPIEIRAVKEGKKVPLRCPMFVIWNTKPEFFWLTNYLETAISAVLWGPCTSATVANEYRKILNNYAERTVGETSFVPYQGHDFSCRGMFGMEAAAMSGAAHLLSFQGTDTVPAIDFIDKYYSLDARVGKEAIGVSVPATEHSVMCLGAEEGEIETIRRLITETYPKGIVSIVCDTWDFWKVMTRYLPTLKKEIMARDGKVVVRPDSGDPADILCGVHGINKGTEAERKGAVEVLWDTFGGTLNDKGYKELDPHVGLIYGDSITLDRCRNICSRLAYKSFASTNVVFGVGSYTYQYTTRDTFGFAIKATYAEVNGEPREIFKTPKTDDGTKNSAKGLVAVFHDSEDDTWSMKDQATWEEVKNCSLELVYKDGVLVRNESIDDIRKTLRRSG